MSSTSAKLHRAGVQIEDALDEAARGGHREAADDQHYPMTAKGGRDVFRGAEGQMLDLIFEVGSSQQWARFLKAPLERAVAFGSRDLAQRLVGAGAEIEDALPRAIKGGHGMIASDLLKSGASIDAKDTEGYTPLHIAADQGKTEMVQLLLLEGANKDAFDSEELTPLYLAVYECHLAAVLVLLAAGADVSLRCGQFKTPLMHVAAKRGAGEILKTLIEQGAELDAVDGNLRTALHDAASHNKPETIDVLVDAGVNIEERTFHGSTPLCCAALKLGREAVLCLLNTQDEDLQTPLMCAAYFAGKPGTAEMVDYLLRADADETIVDENRDKAADLIGVVVEKRTVWPRMSSACASCWPTPRPTGHGPVSRSPRQDDAEPRDRRHSSCGHIAEDS